MAAVWWGTRLQTGCVPAFVGHLANTVEAELLASGRVDLVCDLDPKGLLLDALHAAGIPCAGALLSATGVLPTRHRLIVRPGVLMPKEGYGNWTPHMRVPSD
jgi:hypothetical protein